VLGAVSWDNSSGTIPTVSSISDSRGNTYTADEQVDGGVTVAMVMFRGRITNALDVGDTITITISAARVRWAINVDGFDDILQAHSLSPLDVHANTPSVSSTSLNSGTTGRTAQDKMLVYVAYGLGAGRIFTPPAGWTAAASVETSAGSSDRAVKCLHKYATVIGTQNAVTTINTSATYVGAISTYKVINGRANYSRTDHRAESLADATTLTPSNSNKGSGIAFTTVTGDLTAVSTNVGKGVRAMKATVTAATTATGTDTNALGIARIVRGRALVKISANPPANLRIAQADNSGTPAVSIGINGSGKVRIQDSAGTDMLVSTSSVPLNSYFRIEWRFVASATDGQATLSLWTNPDSTGSPDETLSTSPGGSFNTRSRFDAYQSGAIFASNQTYTLHLDEVVWTTDDADEVGPYSDTFEDVRDFEGGTPLEGLESTGNVDVDAAAARSGSAGLRLDAQTLPAFVQYTPLSLGFGRRYAALAAWMRRPSGGLGADSQLVTFINSDPLGPIDSGVGNIWIDSTTGFINANLDPGTAITRSIDVENHWFYLQAVCVFDQGTASLKVKIDGVEIGTVNGTPTSLETLEKIVIGSEAVVNSLIDVDTFEMTVSDAPLDYIGSAAKPPGMYVRSGGIWVPVTPYVLESGAWVEASPHVRSGGSWVELL